MNPVLADNQGFTLIEMLITGLILSIIVSLCFFPITLYLNEWEQNRLGNTAVVEQYRQNHLVADAVESAWEYYITDPYNERMDVYYPYFKGDEKSVAFVTTSPVFSDKSDAAARLRLEDSKDNTGNQLLIYEEAPLETFFIRYHDDNIDYPYSFRFPLNGNNFRMRYYGLIELRFMPLLEDFEEILGWHDSFDGKERLVMPEMIEIVKSTDDRQTARRSKTKAACAARLESPTGMRI